MPLCEDGKGANLSAIHAHGFWLGKAGEKNYAQSLLTFARSLFMGMKRMWIQ